jgi:hypothetical protein
VVPSEVVVTVIESVEIRLKVLVADTYGPVAVIVTTVVPKLLGKVPLMIPAALSSRMVEGSPVCE